MSVVRKPTKDYTFLVVIRMQNIQRYLYSFNCTLELFCLSELRILVSMGVLLHGVYGVLTVLMYPHAKEVSTITRANSCT